ncbi:MAG: hypothetical protein AAFO79_02575, partial [Pseudomonadota bacterium]
MSERIALIDYGSGNLHSAHKALERATREAGVDAVIELTDRPDLAGRADRIVLPGVGSFGGCAAGLRACDGMVEALEKRVLQDEPTPGNTIRSARPARSGRSVNSM